MSLPDPGSDRFVVDGITLYSLQQINELSKAVKERIYRHLVPDQLLARYDIDRQTLCDTQGYRLVTFGCPSGSQVVEIDIRPHVDFPDPLLYLELGDTRLNQIEVLLAVVNDPESERFETDRDWQGARTKFGTFKRNIPEEVRAMEAGLAPGQVRRGLRMARVLVPMFEDFVRRMGHQYYLLQPLAYHNAVLFERLGCNYARGLRKMQWIHDSFQPGGMLHQGLDGSSPFRQPDAWKTVRGRSWAIHDGILQERWGGVQMYKRVNHNAGLQTFPDARY